MAVKPPPAGFPDWAFSYDLGRAVLAPNWPAGTTLISMDWYLYRPLITATWLAGLTTTQRAALEASAASAGVTTTQLQEPVVQVSAVVRNPNGSISGVPLYIIGQPPAPDSVLSIPGLPNLHLGPVGRNAFTGELIYNDIRILSWVGAAAAPVQTVGSFTGYEIPEEERFIPAPTVAPEPLTMNPPPSSQILDYPTAGISGELPPANSSPIGIGVPTVAPSTGAQTFEMPQLNTGGGVSGGATQTESEAAAFRMPAWVWLLLAGAGLWFVVRRS